MAFHERAPTAATERLAVDPKAILALGVRFESTRRG